MSDHAHDEHAGHGPAGHEIDNMPSRKLFNLLFGLSALTLVACIGVVQLFYQQVDYIRDSRNTKVSFQLTEYQREMQELSSAWGPVLMTDDDGVPAAERGKGVHEAKRFQMPLAEARKRMLAEPAKYLKAKPAYRGWRNPDPKAPKTIAKPSREAIPAARRPGGSAKIVPTRPGRAGPAGGPSAGDNPTPPKAAPSKPASGKPASGKPARGKPAKPARSQ